jgi:hypothetical protein
LAGGHIGKQSLKGRALEGATRETTIIVAGLDLRPAFLPLARDIGLTGFILRIQ